MRREAFERLWEVHAQPLLAFLVYRTGDRALAEDLVADTFERVIHARRRFDPRRGSEKTWLYTIALNLLRDHARKKSAEAAALERAGPAPSASGGAIAAVADRDAVMRALADLPPDEREAVALRYGADLTVPEVARVLGEPLQRVEGRVYRGLRKLRDVLPPDTLEG
jgi:RNA polymerase sigma factor (sigma-70 family)